VITRPTLGNLTPGGSADGFNLRVSFGNPFLAPFRAWAYDLGFEWYFAPQSVFSVALFRKEVSSFPVSVNRTDSFDSTGLPVSVAEDPLASVVLGTGKMLSDFDLLKRVKWDNSLTSGT